MKCRKCGKLVLGDMLKTAPCYQCLKTEIDSTAKPIICDKCGKPIHNVKEYSEWNENGGYCADCASALKTAIAAERNRFEQNHPCPSCARHELVLDQMILPYHRELREQNKALKKLVLQMYEELHHHEDKEKMDRELRDLLLDIRHEADLEKNEVDARLDAEREVKRALDVLLQVMLYATNDCDDDSYDTIFSHGNGHYADAIRLLAEHGKVAIIKDAPFNLIAKEIPEKKEEEKKDE